MNETIHEPTFSGSDADAKLATLAAATSYINGDQALPHVIQPHGPADTERFIQHLLQLTTELAEMASRCCRDPLCAINFLTAGTIHEQAFGHLPAGGSCIHRGAPTLICRECGTAPEGSDDDW